MDGELDRKLIKVIYNDFDSISIILLKTEDGWKIEKSIQN
jgi:hypothetical protein